MMKINSKREKRKDKDMSPAIIAAIVSITGNSSSILPGIQDSQVLVILAEMESGGNPRARGKLGERSIYQLRELTWKTYSKFPFSQRYTTSIAIPTKVALAYLQQCCRIFRNLTSRHPTPEDVYVMWNVGITRYTEWGFEYYKVHSKVRNRANQFNLKIQKEKGHKI